MLRNLEKSSARDFNHCCGIHGKVSSTEFHTPTTTHIIDRTSNPDVLGQVLCLLIAQLGRQNPVIKGAACMNVRPSSSHRISFVKVRADSISSKILSESSIFPHSSIYGPNRAVHHQTSSCTTRPPRGSVSGHVNSSSRLYCYHPPPDASFCVC